MEKRLRLYILSVAVVITILSFFVSGILNTTWVNSVFISFIIIMVILLLLFLQWALRPMGRKDTINIVNTQKVDFSKTCLYYGLSSKVQTKNTGVIFYPGGRIVPEAYLPILQDIASLGFPVFIVKMPFNMAVFDYSRATKIIQEHPKISNWIIGGHSLGGAMAAHHVMKKPYLFTGMFLWGAYPSRRDDMSGLKLPILVIYADCDGITSIDKIEQSKYLFPDHTNWVKIEGGNHSQFGCYGIERQDQPSKISPEEQRNKLLNATLSFIDEINKD